MTKNKNKSIEVFFLCRRGVANSATRLDREPTAAELAILATAGLEPATVGEYFMKTVRCPVNGDGYWYTRRELLDADGKCVGTFEVEQGPRGAL